MDVNEEGKGPIRTASEVDLLAPRKNMYCRSSYIAQSYGYSSSCVGAIRKENGCYGPQIQGTWKNLHDDHQEFVNGADVGASRTDKTTRVRETSTQ